MRQSRRKERTISIEEQRRVITAWAKANGVKLAPEVIEQGVSGFCELARARARPSR
jgi:hypothetical protein